MSISAKYRGVCAQTWREYSAGTRLIKTEQGWAIDDDLRLPQDATIRVHRGDGGKFEVGDAFRHNTGQIVRVVSYRSRYYAEDGLSFGVGAESGYVHTALCCPATQEESKPVIMHEQEREARHESEGAYSALFDKTQGEFVPSRPSRPCGELVKIKGDHSITGHGTEILIQEGETHVWLLEDNGADGHCWAASNIGTPGCPGEIGYRFEATPERLAWVRNYQRYYEERDARQADKIRIASY